MSTKLIWGIQEWESSLLNNKAIPADHPLKAKDRFGLASKKPFSTGTEGKAILTALTTFDAAAAKFAGNLVLKSREDAYNTMVASSSDFKTNYNALNNWFVQKVNPAGKGFCKELMDEWTKMVRRKDKVAMEMNNTVTSARTTLETLKAGPPALPPGPPRRPQSAAPSN